MFIAGIVLCSDRTALEVDVVVVEWRGVDLGFVLQPSLIDWRPATGLMDRCTALEERCEVCFLF